MNRNIYVWPVLFVAFVSGWLIQGCDTLEVDTFGSERSLYFERRINVNGDWKNVDTATISITNYPGDELIRHPFRICLIGDTLAEDGEYVVMAVDSLTTAHADMVTLPEQIVFRKGMAADSLWLTIHTDKVAEGGEYYITLRLVANENFGLGYTGYHQVKLWFNNIESQPLWWDSRIETVYLGSWSPEKFEILVIATGVKTFEGLSGSEMRYYSLKLKKYIESEGITEADGSAMEVPIY